MNLIKLINEDVRSELDYINVSRLESGWEYQRDVSNKKVRNGNFDFLLCRPIVVSNRGGRYHVVDGQHRISKYKEAGGSGDLPCQVYFDLTYEQEALLCAKSGMQPKHSAAEIVCALIEAKDVDTLDIKSIVESHGFKWSLKEGKGDNKIISIAQLENIYKKMGKDVLSKTLETIQKIWKGESSSLSSGMIGGFSVFINTYKNDYDEFKLIEKLLLVSTDKILRQSYSYQKYKTAQRFARVIVDQYNFNLKKNRLDEDLLK